MNTIIKYTPKSLRDFDFATTQLKHHVMRYVQGGSTAPLVLYGKNGTGKSTLAKLIPEAIEGTSVQVNKVMASTLNSEQEVMDKFTRSVMFDKFFVPAGQSINYTVVEEVNFEAKASSALRVALDEMAGRNLFIFTTNEIAKIDKGLASRATLVEVPPVPPEIFITKAMAILKAEKIKLKEADILDVLDSVYEMHQDNRKYFDALDELISRVNMDMNSIN
jgi:replication-associated recombination protein RarA